jgi:ribosomal-protein-alanine N-acetyltransferase
MTFNPVGFAIRNATLRDLHHVRRLEQVVFGHDAYSYLNLSTLIVWPGAVNLKLLDRAGTIIGFVAGQPNFTTQIDWIITLCVHPNYRGQGLGRWLLANAENGLTFPRLRLTVRVSNNTAIALYDSVGYTRLYVEPHYYNDGEDGMVMEKVRKTV